MPRNQRVVAHCTACCVTRCIWKGKQVNQGLGTKMTHVEQLVAECLSQECQYRNCNDRHACGTYSVTGNGAGWASYQPKVRSLCVAVGPRAALWQRRRMSRGQPKIRSLSYAVQVEKAAGQWRKWEAICLRSGHCKSWIQR